MLARVSLGAYLLFVGFTVWMPERVSTRVTGVVEVMAQRIADAGIAPFHASATVLEVLANVALFVPIGVLLPLAVTGMRVWQATVVGAALTVVIESVQLFLPTRYPAVSDLIANTAGAFLGALLAVGVARLHAASWQRPKRRLSV